MSVPLQRRFVTDTLTINVPRQYDIPRNNAIRGIACRLAGSVTVSGGTTSGTLKDSSTLAMIRSLEVRRNGQDSLIKVEPALLHRINQIFRGTRPTITEMANDNAQTNTLVDANFEIPFEVLRGISPIDTFLKAGGLSSLQLSIDVGSTSDLVVGGDRVHAVGTTAFTFVAEAMEERGLDNWVTGDMKLYSASEVDITASSSGLQVKLPVGNEYYAIVLVARDNQICANTILNNIRLTASGSEVFWDSNALALQQENKTRFRLEAMPAGFFVLWASRDGMLNSAIDTRLGTGRNSLELTLDVTKTANACKLSTYVFEYMRPKPVAPSK